MAFINGKKIPTIINTISDEKEEIIGVVNPTASGQTLVPSSGKLFSSVVITGDTDLKPENVKSGVKIFDVDGTFEGIAEPVTINPTAAGFTLYPTITREGTKNFSEITVNGDENLIPENVKAGVQIFNVLGTLVSGGGDLPSLIDKIDAGTFTVDTKLNTAQTVNHNLGVAPDMWICWVNLPTQEDYESFIESTTSIVSGIVGGIYIKNMIQRIDASNNRQNTFYSFVGTTNNGTSPITVNASNANAAMPTSTTFTVMRAGTSVYFKPNFTYKWVAIKFKES